MKKRGKPNVKTRSLRDQVRALETRLTKASAHNGTLQFQLDHEHTHRAAVEADLDQITRRLRAICRHTFALEAKGTVSMQTRKVPSPGIPSWERIPEEHYFRGRSIEALDLAQLLFWAESYPHRFARYMYFEVADFKRGDHLRAAYAVTDDVLMMMRGDGPELMARHIAENFGAHIYKALQK